jgi:hypothetical protein
VADVRRFLFRVLRRSDAFTRGPARRHVHGARTERRHVGNAAHLRSAYGVLRARQTIGAQWTLAFEIGVANHAGGAPVASIGDLIRRLRDYRRMAAQHPPGPLIAGAARSLAAQT